MTLSGIAQLRLINQQLIGGNYKTPQELVYHMGAMQAQDLIMAKWAVGLRCKGSDENTIEQAINNGDIIRTHVMRPTWHFICKEDVRNMVRYSAPRILSSTRSRDRNLELTAGIFKKSNTIIGNLLRDGKHLTKDEIVEELQRSGIKTDENRASHLMMRAELEEIICSGPLKKNKPTYALLDERVPKSKPNNREEFLSDLAHRYIKSHGPVTHVDFSWWAGITKGESEKTFDNNKKNLVKETMGAQTYWLDSSFQIPAVFEDSVFFLPAYDEFIISYTDRTASLPAEVNSRAISSNGLFRPVIVLNGQVVGLWKRSLVKERMNIEVRLFLSPEMKLKQLLSTAIKSYEHFTGRKVNLVFV